MTARRRITIGFCIVGLYVGLAATSGHLSPIARGPLLDGLGPAQPYRWVNPPPTLASTNQPPLVGRFAARFVHGAIRGQVFVNGDAQATVIVPNNAFPPHGRDDAVVLTFTPVDPATLGRLPDGGIAFGNAYLLTAAYRPSGVAAPDPRAPIDLVLIYPVTPDLHAATHSVYASVDGAVWSALKGTDAPSVQQAEGKITHLGYAVVGGVSAPTPVSTSPSGSGGTRRSSTTILLVIALSVLFVGVGLLLRSKGAGSSPGDVDA